MASIQENNTSASRWFDVDIVPQTHTFPEEYKPGKSVTENAKRSTFSVIDLSKIDCSPEEKEETIKQLLKACQDVGIFQVINHGFSEELIEETTKVFNEFYSLPVEEKVFQGNDGGWLYLNTFDKTVDGVYLWRESLKHYCYPLEDCMQYWPENPSRYRLMRRCDGELKHVYREQNDAADYLEEMALNMEQNIDLSSTTT